MPEPAGQLVDEAGRCVHHQAMLDVLAIRLPCCAQFWACHQCHKAAFPDHPLQVWPRTRRDVAALLCGVCKGTFSIQTYLSDPDACPHCSVPFNPGCRSHHGLYFR